MNLFYLGNSSKIRTYCPKLKKVKLITSMHLSRKNALISPNCTRSLTLLVILSTFNRPWFRTILAKCFLHQVNNQLARNWQTLKTRNSFLNSLNLSMTFKWLNYLVTLVKVISMDLDSIKSKTKFWLTVLTAQILQDLLFSLRNMCNKKQLRKLKIT